MSTLPRNTVTGAPQNFRQRVSRKAACGPRLPRVLGATARASARLPGLHSRLFSVSRLSSSCRSSRPVRRGASSLKVMRLV